MHAVYVLPCTLQLTTFSLQCNLSKSDMLSLYQCGKLLNPMCSKQWAAVSVGNTSKHTVILAAALWYMHLLVIKSQNRAKCSSQLHQHKPSNLWILKRPWDGVLWHTLISCEVNEKAMTGRVATVLQGPLPAMVLFVQFLAVHFELNRIRAIPAWITHEANSPSISCSPPPCTAGTKDKSVQIVTRILWD